MRHISRWLLTGLLASIAFSTAPAADNAPAKKTDTPTAPPALVQLLQGTPAQFIQRFDKDKKGYLKKEDLPPRLAQQFARWDKDNDGKLDRREVAAWMQAMRKNYGLDKPATDNAKEEIDRIVNQILERMDTNKDGKISRAEARGQIAANFDQLDKNKDGFIDRKELRELAAQRLSLRATANTTQPMNKPRPAPLQVTIPDFDALDLNADGRLTREELKGTPYAALFDAMDTNKDGKIDTKEWANYFRRQAEKKAQASEDKGK